MLSFAKYHLSTKVKTEISIEIPNFAEIFWKEIQHQTFLWGCVTIASKDGVNKIIDAAYKNNYCRQKIDANLLERLELSGNSSESIIDCVDYSGRVYLITKNKTTAKYLVVLSDRDRDLNPEVKQIVRTYIQLVAKYFCLEQQKERELQDIVALLHQMEHHIRNHLAEISILAETIRLHESSFGQIQAQEIHQKVVTLNRDLQQMSRLSTLVSGSKQKRAMHQDIRAISQTSINEFKNLINAKNIHVTYPQTTAYLVAEDLQLKQIFDNLLSNAIHFSPDSSTIHWHWQSFQSEILISICDRGCGLSPEDLQNMFCPFYSRRKDGQGLGLSIVKNLVLELKGNIWAENISQGGAKISIVLPKQ